MKKNIVGMVIVLFIMIATIPLTANRISSTQKVKPEEK